LIKEGLFPGENPFLKVPFFKSSVRFLVVCTSIEKRLSIGIRADLVTACAETYLHLLYAQMKSHAQPLKDFITGTGLGRMKEGAPQSTIWFNSRKEGKDSR
jgi:hypothetical protein